jgi:hypothetical protein
MNRDLTATNNASERALRPRVICRKITNGFRSQWGAALYADIRSVIETARRRPPAPSTPSASASRFPFSRENARPKVSNY